MTTHQKILIGGLGALTPAVLNLAVVDLHILLIDLTVVALLAYLIRVAVLFAIGGLVAYFHKSEKSPIKLFQLGLAAPALITSLLNGGQVEIPKAPAAPESPPGVSSLFVPSAYAQVTPRQDKTFSLPKETLGEQFQRGFTGAAPKRVWFVIAGSHPNRGSAQKQAGEITKKFSAKGFKAEVYSPSAGNSSWSVVIGSNLTSEEAQKLRQRAITAGLPKDTHLWTFAK